MKRVNKAFLLVAIWLSFGTIALPNELLNAALSGDINTARELLAGGVEVDAEGPATPLYFAAQNGHIEIVALLIKHGADVNAVSKNGTPLHIAARRNRAEIVSLLLENGASPNAVGGGYRHTPLHMAARTGALKAGRVLVDHGADVNARTRWFEPPIHFAVKKDRREFADYLRQAGFAPLAVKEISSELASADIESGRIRAIECSNCHLMQLGQVWGSEIPQVRGPSLWDVIGRPIASLEGFKYSPALSSETGSWTYERLNQYLADPTGYVPGTDMFAGHEQDHNQRTALIAYLRTLSETPVPLP